MGGDLVDFSPISRIQSRSIKYVFTKVYQFYCKIPYLQYLFQYTTLEPFLFSSTKKIRVSTNFPSFAPFSLQESPQIQLTLEHEHCAELEGDVTTQDFEEAVGWWWFLSSLLHCC